MGFTRLVVPAANADPSESAATQGCQVIGVRTLGEALDSLLA
jgi:hypothetical protein